MTFLAVILAPTVRAYVHQRGEISALQEHLAEQKRHVAVLQAETQRWKDPAYVEQQARERLKLVKPGERSYTVIDGTTSAVPAAPATGVATVPPDMQRSRPWYGEVWESIRIADSGVAPAAPTPAPSAPATGKAAPPAVTDTAPPQ